MSTSQTTKPGSMAGPTVFPQNAPAQASTTNSPTINVKMGDYIVLPAVPDCARVTIAWSQDNSPRTAEYLRGYGFNMSATNSPEVLVYIAAELVLPSLSDRVPLHLGSITRNDEACLTYPNSETKTKHETKTVQNRANTNIEIKSPWIKITPDWQYGVLNDNLGDKKEPSTERFIVYHPKSRTPFTKRFEMAQVVPQGAFMNALNGVSNVSAGNMSAGDSWGVGNFIAVAGSMLACQAVTQGIAVPLIDKLDGKNLKNFTQGEVAKN